MKNFLFLFIPTLIGCLLCYGIGYEKGAAEVRQEAIKRGHAKVGRTKPFIWSVVVKTHVLEDVRETIYGDNQ